ncbi:MAG TPA: single-stranded DNA-binding protein [Planctomycetota bacterium]|nr:single-stranded DNA-binding protein [Planctomycetota bacterium]
MSMSLNKVFLMGNLTRDPELKYTPQGTAVCEFSIAVNEKFKGKDGNWQDKVHYIDIQAWARQAETCGEYLKKGRPVFVEGSLQHDRWEQEGQKRSKVRVRAFRVLFLGGPGGAPAGGVPEAAEAPAEAGPEPGPGDQEPPF